MILKRFHWITSITVLLFCSVVVSSQSPLPDQKAKSEALVPYQPTNCDKIRDHFRDTLLMFGKPGGMAMTNKICAKTMAAPDDCPGNMEERLNAIMQADSHFVWSDQNGVINLLPVDSESGLVETKIREFKVVVGDDLSVVIEGLRGQAEFIARINELKLKRPPMEIMIGISSPPTKLPKEEFTFVNKTIREILNEIIGKRGRGTWLYDEHTFEGHTTYRLELLGS